MNYQQIIEQRNTILAEAGRLAQGKRVDAETRAKVQTMLAEADSLKIDADIARTLSDHQEELRSSSRPPRTELSGSVKQQEVRALKEWMQTGNADRSVLRESRDLGAFSGNGQGTNTITSSVLLPISMDSEIVSAQKSYGQLATAVRQLKTAGGEALRYSLADDVSREFQLLNPEQTAVTESDPTLTGGISYVDDIATYTKVHNNLLNDAAYSVSQFLEEEFLAAYFRTVNKAVQLGNGSNVASIAGNVPVKVTTASPTAITPDELAALYASIDPSYLSKSSILASPQVRAALMMIKDTTGRSILQPDATGTPFNAIYGLPFVLSANAPAALTAGAVPLIAGDLTSYSLRTVGDISIERNPYLFSLTNQTAFVARARIGGWSRLIASSPALVSLKMHA